MVPSLLGLTLCVVIVLLSGVERVSSARGPMLASAPPPPPGGGGGIDKQKEKKEKKGRQQEKEKKDPHRERGALESAGSIAYATFAARLIRHCNEVTLIICLGLIFFLKFAPISWAGAPSKACAHGPCPPLPPPPLATPLVLLIKACRPGQIASTPIAVMCVDFVFVHQDCFNFTPCRWNRMLF